MKARWFENSLRIRWLETSPFSHHLPRKSVLQQLIWLFYLRSKWKKAENGKSIFCVKVVPQKLQLDIVTSFAGTHRKLVTSSPDEKKKFCTCNLNSNKIKTRKKKWLCNLGAVSVIYGSFFVSLLQFHSKSIAFFHAVCDISLLYHKLNANMQCAPPLHPRCPECVSVNREIL